jgi:RNA polymerase sigma-70 factor (ECF subfamily)
VIDFGREPRLFLRERTMHDGPKTRRSLLHRLSDPPEREAAWQEFLDLYAKLVYRFILRHGINTADAEVLTQEVLIKVWRSLGTYAGQGPFRSWLQRMARNCVCDYWRQQPRDRASGNPAAAEQLEGVADPHWEEDWHDHLYQLACDRVRKQVQSSHWRAFCEFALEGHSAKEVEALTGERASYVPVIKARVQKRLNAEIQLLRSEWGD